MLQACLKSGTEEQKGRIKAQCKTDYYKLMQDKYGHHLAERLYDTAFDELEQKAVVTHIMDKMDKYLVHMYACDMVEHVYKTSKAAVKGRMFESVFGPKLTFLKVLRPKAVGERRRLQRHRGDLAGPSGGQGAA